MFDIGWTDAKEKDLNYRLQNKKDLDRPDSDGYYLIHWAVEQDLIEIVKWLGRQGINLNQMTSNGITPIVIAIIRSNYKMTHWLLSHGAKIYIYSLHLALKNLDLPIISLLLRYGADINSQDPDGNTILHLAVYYKLADMVPFLLDRGADREIRNHRGETAIQLLYRN